MMRKFIPVEEAFQEWRKDPEYVAAYDTLEEEFAPGVGPRRTRDSASASSRTRPVGKVPR